MRACARKNACDSMRNKIIPVSGHDGLVTISHDSLKRCLFFYNEWTLKNRSPSHSRMRVPLFAVSGVDEGVEIWGKILFRCPELRLLFVFILFIAIYTCRAKIEAVHNIPSSISFCYMWNYYIFNYSLFFIFYGRRFNAFLVESGDAISFLGFQSFSFFFFLYEQ